MTKTKDVVGGIEPASQVNGLRPASQANSPPLNHSNLCDRSCTLVYICIITYTNIVNFIDLCNWLIYTTKNLAFCDKFHVTQHFLVIETKCL